MVVQSLSSIPQEMTSLDSLLSNSSTITTVITVDNAIVFSVTTTAFYSELPTMWFSFSHSAILPFSDIRSDLVCGTRPNWHT